MPSGSNQQKDRWDKFKIATQALIPFVALAFTIVFDLNQQKNADATLQLARSNFELARIQVEVSLIPLLSSENAEQRTMALYLAKTLDLPFAAEVTSAIGVSDPDEGVRETARVILGSLSQSEQGAVQQKAQKGANQYDIVNELRPQGLIQKLQDARGYIEGGSPNGNEEALKLYHEVLTQLSDSALKKLDQRLLMDAQEDEKLGYKEHAARKYQALFEDYGG